ncbi:MAG TPA: histidine kinase [Ornithinibacter sp.]|nr:histidine kinase [Ornithinibacter sp.]
MARATALYAGRFGGGATREARLRAYLHVNLLAIWSSVIALVVLRVVLGPSRTIMGNLSALVACGILLLTAEVLAARDRSSWAAGVTVVATWFVALAITWVGPFLTPVGLLALLLPLVIVADHLTSRLRTPAVAMTIVLSGVLAGVGMSRWPAYEASHPVTTSTVLIVALFVPVLVTVLVAGLRDYVLRLRERTRELEESRARLAVAAIEARRSIERDLHDGAQQRLTTLAVDLGRLTRMWDQDPPQARTIVDGLQGQIEAAIRELRDLAHGIYPPLLGERGLVGALPAAARRTILPCTVDVRSLGRHSPSVEAAVYFCCTEAIQNADRHSGGSIITVQASDDEGPGRGLRFSVSDDGHGFDPGAVRSAHGLTGMRDRIRAAGGELRVISAPGHGTTVEGHFAPGTRQRR